MAEAHGQMRLLRITIGSGSEASAGCERTYLIDKSIFMADEIFYRENPFDT
jgi:hypothetical protein